MDSKKVNSIKLYSEEDENLKRFVSTYWFLKKISDEKEVKEIFPMVKPHILVQIGDEYTFKINGDEIQGRGNQVHHPMNGMCEITYGTNTCILGVELTAQGYYYLTGSSSEKLINKIESLEESHKELSNFFNKNIEKLKDEKIEKLREYFISIFSKFYDVEDSKLIFNIVNDMDNDEKIVEITKKYKINIRTLERKFKKNTGLTLKKYQLIIRLNKLLDDIYMKEKIEWSELALEHGFFDQAHMIKALKKYLGKPPTEYLKLRNLVGDFFEIYEETQEF